MNIPPNKFDEIFTEYKPRLIKFAKKISFCEHRAEEIVQDVFLKLLKQDWGKIEDHIHQWLFFVCKNRCFTVYHKEKKYSSFSDDEELEGKLSEEHNPQESLVIKEDAKKILKLMEKLGPLQRKVLELRFLKGMNNVEIAKKLKIKNTNAAYHVSDGCKKLREMMAQTN